MGSLGVVIGLGLFTRITFMAFVLPLAIYYQGQLWSNAASLPNIYRKINVPLTPWNNLVYNLQTSNLSLHGLHPRYLHIAVNLPLLFGPLVLVFYKQLWTGFLFSKAVGASHTNGLRQAFGTFHQSGVIPAMDYIHRSSRYPMSCHPLADQTVACSTHQPADSGTSEVPLNYRFKTRAVFYKTLMPMPHLLGLPAKDFMAEIPSGSANRAPASQATISADQVRYGCDDTGLCQSDPATTIYLRVVQVI
ncbi:alpha 1,2 mannosyltransferase [Dimargaris xerosporica]|nr:alpha 1,2 mannosyltransferase [Dimargaris xerosporica]